MPKPAVLPMTISAAMPPAREIGKRVLAAVRTHGGKATRGKPGELLQDAWARQHCIITEGPGDLPKLRDGQRSLSKRSLCARLGRCVCKCTETLLARKELCRVIKLFVKKKTPGRAVYDRNGVVLRIASTTGSRARHVLEFFYLGFGNLLDAMYTVQPLELSTAHGDPAFCLASESGLVFYARGSRTDLFDVVQAYGSLSHRTFTVEVLQVKFDADEVMPVFLPCLVAGSMSPILTHQFWPLPKKTTTTAASPHHLALTWEQPDQQQQVAAQEALDDTADGDAGVLDVMDGAGLGEAQLHMWHLPSSDEEPVEPPQPARPARMRVRARTSGAAAVAPAQAEARPVASPAEARVVSNPAVGRVVRVGRWPRVIHSHPLGRTSFVRISQNVGEEHFNYRAHCGCCGATLDRSGRAWRPLGRLWAWLSPEGGACDGDRQRHRQYIPSWEVRIQARASFEDLAGAEEFLQHEAGGLGLGEPEAT